MNAVLTFPHTCSNCGGRDATVRAYQLILAGRPLSTTWQCHRCWQLACEFVDLRPLPVWRERALDHQLPPRVSA